MSTAINYSKTNWENYPSTDTPVTAEALNKIENGIAALDQTLYDHMEDARRASSAASGAQSSANSAASAASGAQSTADRALATANSALNAANAAANAASSAQQVAIRAQQMAKASNGVNIISTNYTIAANSVVNLALNDPGIHGYTRILAVVTATGNRHVRCYRCDFGAGAAVEVSLFNQSSSNVTATVYVKILYAYSG